MLATFAHFLKFHDSQLLCLLSSHTYVRSGRALSDIFLFSQFISRTKLFFFLGPPSKSLLWRRRCDYVCTIVDSWGSINKDEDDVSFYFFSGEVINLMRFSLLCMSRRNFFSFVSHFQHTSWVYSPWRKIKGRKKKKPEKKTLLRNDKHMVMTLWALRRKLREMCCAYVCK